MVRSTQILLLALAVPLAYARRLLGDVEESGQCAAWCRKMYQGGHPGSVGECISLASQGKGPCYQCLDLNPGLGSLADWEKAARKGQRWFPPFDGSGKALRSSSWQDENAWIGIRVSHKVDCPLRECSIDAQCPWASQCIDDLCTAVIEEVKKCVCFPFAVKKTEDLCVTMPDMERPCDDGTFCKDEHCQVGCKDSQCKHNQKCDDNNHCACPGNGELNDDFNCNECGNECTNGTSCRNTAVGKEGWEYRCICPLGGLNSDMNCGECGHACEEGYICKDGICECEEGKKNDDWKDRECGVPRPTGCIEDHRCPDKSDGNERCGGEANSEGGDGDGGDDDGTKGGRDEDEVKEEETYQDVMVDERIDETCA